MNKAKLEEVIVETLNSTPTSKDNVFEGGYFGLAKVISENILSTVSPQDEWIVNPTSADDASTGIVYLILKEEDSHPTVGSYGDNYGYFATPFEVIDIKDVYAIKKFQPPVSR